MFFPCSSDTLNRRFSRKNWKKIERKIISISGDVDRVGVTKNIPITDDVDRVRVTKNIPISDGVARVRVRKDDSCRKNREDEIRKTYGDNLRLEKIHGEAYLRQLYGYDKLPVVDSMSTESNTIQIVIGEKLKCGVRGLLSNNGKTTHLVRFQDGVLQDQPVDFDSLDGKHLLICCFNLPMHRDAPNVIRCRSLIDLYDEMLSRRDCPFEMVVVANLRTDIVYDLKAAFDHFYSAFSCLAIPFSDFETRDYMHSYMRCSIDFDLDSAILVDPQGLVLEGEEAFIHFFNYGSEWAPHFLPTTLDAINEQDHLLRSRLDPMYLVAPSLPGLEPLSLYADILLCDPLLTLRRFDAETHQLSTVLDLSRKYVGLYLFIDGDIIEDIKAAHDHCLAKKQQLEIVLVPMPFHDEPNSYNEQLDQALRSLKIKSWFLFHRPNGVCRKLWRIFGRGWFWPGEKFIIIPPDCKSGELLGREVLINLGVDQYPFTRTAILKQRLEYARSFTPIFSSSLFNNCEMIQNGEEFKSEQLQGKNVLLYLSWTERDRYSLMKKHYPEIKAMGWEVVLVLLDYTDRCWNNKGYMFRERSFVSRQEWPCFDLKEMPWPYMLLSAAAGPSIKKLFFPGADNDTAYLLAVGKDGKIVSRNAEHRLDTDGVTESLFDDVLEADLAHVLACMPLYDGYEY